ncbi:MULTISPECIES: ABC transporter permease [Halomonadaceae]|uniref:ABC transporter permease n=1 Tax=Halomonadaceae TaxID=28256 RepID=UPI0012F0DE47|nr:MULTISPECIES: ABC transporter permease [Halomonas]CAD5257804.1 putative oligopeptide transporter subunit; permease component of ABC superfamily transporter [Halomonas sp. 156]CAD5291363.1 putative oligopeptide transporter subunit; permease component of ABC superfamily transporter [Halomonas sp. 113]CAD5292647.1 putative oligopeptide transporter subunit; permease component of ABC superfamily transporter [Halomonas sp. 59]CAD5296309.1 putative oligopeptide transporter subunit; permease compone
MASLSSRLSPITRRRLSAFKANRRARVSLWLFATLFILSLFAELIANDKPIIMQYDGQWYFPMLVDYPETEFDGFLPTRTDYLDPFVQQQIDDHGWALWPIIPFSYQTLDMNMTRPSPAPPDSRHWLGTDDQGRDVTARVIYGFRLSVAFALALTAGSLVVGVVVGGVQGYFGGKIDLIGQRFTEIWSGLPVLFLLIILASFVQPGFWWLLGIMLLFSWLGLVDIVRAEFLRARNLEYVRAAKAMGLPSRLIMWRHVLPNAMVATLTFIPFLFTGAIGTLTALDFLGFGLPPGAPSLGELAAQGKNNLHAPWLGITAFMTLAIMLSLLVFIGEGLRDAFDPRHVQQRQACPAQETQHA